MATRDRPRGRAYGRRVLEADALTKLPPLHAEVLRLKRLGHSDARIAGRVGVEPDEVPPLVRVAEAKLHRLVGRAGIDVPMGSAPS